jgi:PPK2 family polyphosphate:nucleotide phosphotransferase
MSEDGARWRVKPGKRPDLSRIDPSSSAGFRGGKAAAKPVVAGLQSRLGALQDRLWAEGSRSLLVVLQAMDAAGKDGTVKHVFAGTNPMAMRTVAYKAPTEEEAGHDFLWRVHRNTPRAGEIGVFNRSHYEDVLIARVQKLVGEPVWRARYRAIRGFEQTLTEAGTTVVKIYLHISRNEQAERFRARLDDPTKRWKFRPEDLDVRKQWDEYMDAYTEAMAETGTDDCPWYVVPADRKWYRNWAVSRILVETLERLDPRYPPEPPGLDRVVIE